MSPLTRTHKRKIILGLIILVLFVGFKIIKSKPKVEAPEPTTVEKEVAVVEKKASVVTFGEWAPQDFRQVLGEVISDSDVDVKAELNGTIARVNVDVGAEVKAGQALATFKTTGDPTAINYQSALSNLETTKLSSQNSIRSSEIALENARKALAQTMSQQDQSFGQAYENLRVETLTTDTLIRTSIDTLDRMVQFTNKHKFNQSFAYAQIGNNDSIRRQTTKSQAEVAAQKFASLVDVPSTSSKNYIIQQANVRRSLIEDLQTAYTNLTSLLRRGTVSNSQISQAQIDGFVAEAEAILASLNQTENTLQTRIDSAKGTQEGNRTAIINAQNAVESAEQALELSRAQAEAQIVGARNQVNIAGASTADLTVRAPISGTITAKNVRVGDLVNPGQTLFTIVNEDEDKKVQAYLSQDELRQARNATTFSIDIDGQIIETDQVFLSSQLDILTQKVLAEFTIPGGMTLVGNLATVKIPIGGSQAGSNNLIPFSAVSFEPDGAEVLIVGADNVAERRKIGVERVVVSNIEVSAGIEAGTQVIEFYKRVLPGEKVVTPESVKVEAEAEMVVSEMSDEAIRAMIIGENITDEDVAVVREVMADQALLENLEIDPENVVFDVSDIAAFKALTNNQE